VKKVLAKQTKRRSKVKRKLLRKTRIGKLSLIIMIRSKVIGLVTIALVTTTLNNNRLT
jgi:hypothetical protein